MKMFHNLFGISEKYVPIEILVLISTLIDGNRIENQGFSQA